MPAWVPLVTAFAGYAAGFITEWFRDGRVSERERQARQAARREQRFERRTTFQRQTLLDLQEAVMKVLRTTGEMHHQDEMASRAGAEWGKQLFEGDLSERSRLANAQTTLLGVRIRDESVRNLLKEVKKYSAEVTHSRSKGDADRAALALVSEFDKLNNRIGEVLRKLDDDEDQEN